MILTTKEKNSSKLLDICKCDTYIVFPFSILQSSIRVEASWEDIVELVNSFVKCRNNILGYNLGNAMSKMSYKDKIFTFSVFVNKDNFVDICFWDEKGTTCIYSFGADELKIKEEQVNTIQKYLNNYCKGIISCSDCGKELEMSKDIAGSYYAGVYCRDCWESKWKAIEARDNYD